MKFKLLSDLHLEFYNRYRGGDIHVGKKAEPWIKKMCRRFKEVIYIHGNHEYYGNEYYDVLDFWQNVDMPKNFTFLQDNYCAIGNVRIFGACLWTDVTDAFNVWHGRKMMTDYNVIKFNHMKNGQLRKLNVQDTNNFHQETVQKLQQWLQVPWKGKTIVMTHHLPHPACTHEKWKGNNLNDFFMTDLEHIIERFDIDVWCHGHTHDNVDVKVHGTRILCNPMGYHGIQLNQEFDEGLIFAC
jgi:Icc-related predicted phosphoesterase